MLLVGQPAYSRYEASPVDSIVMSNPVGKSVVVGARPSVPVSIRTLDQKRTNPEHQRYIPVPMIPYAKLMLMLPDGPLVFLHRILTTYAESQVKV